MLELDIHKIADLFVYKPEEPLMFSSGFFLFLFTAFLGVYYYLSSSDKPKLIFVTIFSLYFYYKTSGAFFLLLIFAMIVDYTLAGFIYMAKEKSQKKMLLITSIVVNLGMLAYFKYTNFIFDSVAGLTGGQYEPMDIFLPVGISFFTFQSVSYALDVYRGDIKPVDNLLDYGFYLTFFPQLVAGPIVRAVDFVPQIHKPTVVTPEMFGRGVFLIMTGLFKKAVISDYISINFVDRVFDAPTLYSGFENLMAVYGYALQIYCDFSGYSDMAIGIALLLGFHFKQNFNSPYQSSNITEFWRRWHISLSTWLRDYLYISLGGNRKGKVRTYVNLMITMVLGGLWHGASWRFIIWGGLHGAALAVHKVVMERKPAFLEKMKWKGWSILITFHFVCFCWIFFRASNMSVVGDVLGQIFTEFNPGIIFQFVSSYKAVCLVFVIGYVMHFIPDTWHQRAEVAVRKMPLVMKAVCMVAVIAIVMQTKSSEIQPFIYFQF